MLQKPTSLLAEDESESELEPAGRGASSVASIVVVGVVALVKSVGRAAAGERFCRRGRRRGRRRRGQRKERGGWRRRRREESGRRHKRLARSPLRCHHSDTLSARNHSLFRICTGPLLHPLHFSLPPSFFFALQSLKYSSARRLWNPPLPAPNGPQKTFVCTMPGPHREPTGNICLCSTFPAPFRRRHTRSSIESVGAPHSNCHLPLFVLDLAKWLWIGQDPRSIFFPPAEPNVRRVRRMFLRFTMVRFT